MTTEKCPADPSTALTVLVDNNASSPSLGTEHGLAFWIEHDGHRLLFDTGQSSLVVDNADALRVPLAQADAIIVSHGHYDHTGGLPAVLRRAPQAPVYINPEAPRKRYARRESGDFEMIGMSGESVTALESHPGGLRYVDAPTEIFPGLWVSGPIPRQTAWEDPGGPFYLDTAGHTPDMMDDEQALWLVMPEGLAGITGCAHAGIVNTIMHARAKNPNLPVRAIVGGLHLRNASPKRLEHTLDYLRTPELQRLATGHCTGEGAMDRLRRELRCDFTLATAGTVLRL